MYTDSYMKVVIWDREYDIEWDQENGLDIDEVSEFELDARQAYLKALREGTMENPAGAEGGSPGPADIDAILEFLPFLEHPDPDAVEWVGVQEHLPGCCTFPYARYSERFFAFTQALYSRGIILRFNWSEWDAGKHVFQHAPELIEMAGYETIRRMFTAHARSDRFTEGHLGSVLLNGVLAQLARRLAFLRREGLIPFASERTSETISDGLPA